MFGVLMLWAERKCELAHEVEKDSKAPSAELASLVSRVSRGMHFICHFIFNLNVMIFIECKLELTECRSEEPPE